MRRRIRTHHKPTTRPQHRLKISLKTHILQRRQIQRTNRPRTRQFIGAGDYTGGSVSYSGVSVSYSVSGESGSGHTCRPEIRPCRRSAAYRPIVTGTGRLPCTVTVPSRSMM